MLRPLAVQKYVHVMNARGFTPTAVLEGSDIEYSCIGRPDFVVKPEQCCSVVKNVLYLSGDNGIGFDVAFNTTMPELGVFGHTVLTSKSIREAHLLWAQYAKSLVGLMGRLRIVDEDEFSVTFGVTDQGMLDPLSIFDIEVQLGMMYMFGHPLTGETPLVTEARFSYPAPPHGTQYHELLACPIYFDAPRTSIKMTKHWIDLEVRTYDEDFHRMCIQYCNDMMQRFADSPSLTAIVREMFLKFDPSAMPTVDEAAYHLNMSSRTLRRRLHDEGTTYKSETNKFIVEKAIEYLKRRDIAIKEVAYKLGFADPSAFRHAFKNWTGYAIGEFREQLQQGVRMTQIHH